MNGNVSEKKELRCFLVHISMMPLVFIFMLASANVAFADNKHIALIEKTVIRIRSGIEYEVAKKMFYCTFNPDDYIKEMERIKKLKRIK